MKETPFACTLCANAWERYPGEHYCTVIVDGLNEEPIPCWEARRPHKGCGVIPRLFKARGNS